MGGAYRLAADGGIMRPGYQEGGDAEPVAKKTMPLIDMDGKEKDYRETGGFVDMGRMERADDVPARLSKNEFVFTADAVRNAGEGDIDKGAEVMYNMMKNLEAGGEVSEESQGLEGARKMFQTSQRLGGSIIMATQETIARPAPFVEKLGEDLATQVTAQTAVPIVSTGLQGLGTMAQPTQQSFETADDFKRRQDLFKAQQQAALGFESRQQGLAGLRPQVEGLSTLEQPSKTRAQAGLGSFQPFLDQAQAASGAAVQSTNCTRIYVTVSTTSY